MGAVLRSADLGGNSPASDKEALRDLIARRSFRTGKFTLSSGKQSSLYFNMKATLMDPRGSFLAAKALLDIAAQDEPQYVGGLEMGAVPTLGAMAAISHFYGKPVQTFFIRKKPKAHGTRLALEGFAEGESLAGKRVTIIDDVTTSGQSVIKAIETARDEGGEVISAISLVDRNEGAREALASRKVPLRSVFVASDFI